MTTGDERLQEFIERCVEVDDPGALRVGDPGRRRALAGRAQRRSQYHLGAARDNLEGRAPLMAFREGYYVMLHKSSEALALAGFDVKTHECTLLGVRGVFNAPELADSLRRAKDERTNVDYYIDPDDPELVEFAGPGSFIEEEVLSFVARVDDVIEELGLR